MHNISSKTTQINYLALTFALILTLPLVTTWGKMTTLAAQKASLSPTTTSKVDESLISIDIKEVDLMEVFKFMEQQFSVKFIVATDTPKIFVTIKANDVPWFEALGATLQANNLAYQIVDGKWYISPSTTVPPLSHAPKSTTKFFGDSGFSSDPITLDVKDVPLVEVLRLYADNFKFSYTLPQSLLKLKVTIKAENQPWAESLEKALKDKNLRYSHIGNVIYILAN